MAKLTFKKWTAEPPAKPTVGKVREPNPFDDVVLLSYEKQESYSVEVPHNPNAEGYTDRNGEILAYVKMLRNSVRFHKLGVDVRILGDTGIWFAVREPKPRTPKLPNGGPVADSEATA